VRILQIKQAEHALADGRLDEACELIAGGDLRSHRRGQALLGRLVSALVSRGAEHLSAGDARAALADCEKSVELGGNLPEAVALRGRIAEHVSAGRRQERRRGERTAAAREHIEHGRLSAGEALLADAGSVGGPSGRLRQEASQRRLIADAALRRCAAACKRRDFPAAIDELLTARAHRAETLETAALAGEVTSAVLAEARAAVGDGRVERAESLLRRLAPVAGDQPDVAELLRLATECRRGWMHVRHGEFRRAGEVLRRAASLAPAAKWLREAIAAADRGAVAAEALRSGPLGMLGESAPAAPASASAAPAPVETPAVLAPADGSNPAGGEVLPRRFLLQVDGTGSSLVVRDERIAIGPISSSQCPDVGLLAEANLPVVSIERTEGDYFLRSASAVLVNGKATTGKLLADGDKIALSSRCRMRLRLPNASSTSAVLELSTARLPQADIRRVVLLDRELVLGPGAAAHVRSEMLTERAVLHVRDGRLLCRASSPVTAGGKPLDAHAGLPLETPVRIGPVGVVVTRL